jgi:hypothetical protein
MVHVFVVYLHLMFHPTASHKINTRLYHIWFMFVCCIQQFGCIVHKKPLIGADAWLHRRQ